MAKIKLDDEIVKIKGVTKIVLLRFESVPLASFFVSTRGCIIDKSLLEIFHAVLSVVGTIVDLTRGRFFGIYVTKLTTDQLVNGSSCGGIDMVIKDLDLEPKDVIMEFCSPSRWKELSKKTSSKILPCGDESCWKMYQRFLMREKAAMQQNPMLKLTGVSIDEEEKSDKDDDDRSIDIEETDDERTDSENGYQAMTDADRNVAKKVEEEKGEEEEKQANDDQSQEDQVDDAVVGTLVTMSRKGKPEVSRSIIPLPPTTTTPTPFTTPLPTRPISTPLVTPLLPATKILDALIPPSKALNDVLQRVSTLEKDVKELKQAHFIVIVESIKSQVPTAVNEYIKSSLGDSLQRKHDDQDEDPTAGSDRGKEKKRPRKDTQPSKKSSTSKKSSKGITPSKTSKSEQLDSEVVPKIDNAPRNNWFKQPPRTPTPDPEWNKCQVVNDQPKQTWFNDLISVEKDPLTFDKLIATPIDFFKFEMNRHLTVAIEYFFNNDLKYLKSSNLERKYTTSITKMKAAWYELVGIEDMIPKLWSVTKVGYDQDAECGIKH
uniref:Uncharacterized protein n=1 Tax=Tanacetum cinerariifolium TaxID=118510 RepID=A0A6L2JI80_TANCI|nr:hypothetical protein [Tanacetum cinerariifolium]